ncbi:hypothetical protein OQA88_2467 [Cercophora sp. LCS_1]
MTLPAGLLLAPNPPNLAIDPQALIEADLAAGYAEDWDGASCASSSLSESVRDYNFENNRRYHKFREGSYHFPDDKPEQAREDMKHAMIVNLCDGRLHFAPLERPKKILDIGTGTGIWAIDVADEYPEADVLGIDLSPIQPNKIPHNLRFMVNDAESKWFHRPNTFNYIHIRHMTSSIKDWPRLLSQAYKALKPGGWVEIQDLRFVLKCDDGTLEPDDPVGDFLLKIRQGLEAMGVDLLAMEKHPRTSGQLALSTPRPRSGRFLREPSRVIPK